MFLAALVFVLLMSPALPRGAAADCPMNSMSALGVTQLSSNPSASMTQSYTCTADGFPDHASGSVSYNLASGFVTLTVNGGLVCGGGAGVTTHDVFTLTGPASGSPLSFRAELTVSSGGHGGPSGASVRLDGPSNSSPYAPFPGSSTVSVPIQVSPGSPFDLYVEGYAFGGGGGSGGASVGAWLSFPDLPPGYLLTSCQGFTAGIPVPVRATSWGRLKTVYR